MAVYFFDSSGIAKCEVFETGTTLVKELNDLAPFGVLRNRTRS